jgi:hypothetical protein
VSPGVGSVRSACRAYRGLGEIDVFAATVCFFGFQGNVKGVFGARVGGRPVLLR